MHRYLVTIFPNYTMQFGDHFSFPNNDYIMVLTLVTLFFSSYDYGSNPTQPTLDGLTVFLQ